MEKSIILYNIRKNVTTIYSDKKRFSVIRADDFRGRARESRKKVAYGCKRQRGTPQEDIC
jgi:hypothetical protein